MVMWGAVPRSGSWNSRPIIRLRLCSGKKVMSCHPGSRCPRPAKKPPAIAPNRVRCPPVGTHNGGKIARLQLKVDVLQRRFSFTVPGAKGLTYVLQVQHCSAPPFPPRARAPRRRSHTNRPAPGS